MCGSVVTARDEDAAGRVTDTIEEPAAAEPEEPRVLMQHDGEHPFGHHVADGLVGQRRKEALLEACTPTPPGGILPGDDDEGGGP